MKTETYYRVSAAGLYWLGSGPWLTALDANKNVCSELLVPEDLFRNWSAWCDLDVEVVVRGVVELRAA